MRRASLIRSSGFRLALTFTALFLAAAVIAALAGFSVIRDGLLSRHERALQAQFVFFSSAFTDGDLEDLTATVAAYALASRNQDSIVLLQDAAGRKLAGNIDEAPDNLLAPQVSAATLGIDADFNYFVRQGEIGSYCLTVGGSAEDISELEEVFLKGMLWAALLLVALSFAVGVFLARRMNRRIDMIQGTLERVADGQFDARIPIDGKGDDIDTLALMVNTTVARLGASIESIRQISNDISHDLKTPLNRLRIVLEEATENYDLGRPIAGELEEATSETNRILSTFEALLRIAQIESGARKARFVDVDLGTIMSDIVEFYRSICEDEGFVLSIDITGRLAPVQGDRELLTQMFANLLENAIRHCPTNTRITCTVDQVGQSIMAVIADNGPGIPEPEREKVLRRLYRLEQSRTTSGSGLGLALVKAIADLHDATLTLEDNNPGLRVAIQFPVAHLQGW